jgi:glutamate racemase
MNDLPIGIFDSGVGGLTVYRALHDRLPEERFVYLGDTARVPYGTKSLSTVERYAREIARLAPGAAVVERACPLFVSLAEEGWAETEVARMVADEYLRDLRGGRVGALVLGCTHYPILRRVIQEALGEGVRLVDSGEAASEAVAEVLDAEGLRRREFDTHTGRLLKERARAGRLCDDLDHFYVTDAAERFARVAERFLGTAPRVLEAVEVWGTDAISL